MAHSIQVRKPSSPQRLASQRLGMVVGGGVLTLVGLTQVNLTPTYGQAAPTAAPSAAVRSNCPFLNQGRNSDTGTTTATYDPTTKVLNIQVNRSVPGMFWGMAESKTRARATQILNNCPEIAMVEVNFKSGQKLTQRRSQ
jgi:hypothetical protein